MAQAPTPASKPATPGHPASAKSGEKPALPFGAPAVQVGGRRLVAVGTVIHQDEDGKRVVVDHGRPLPDGLDGKTMKFLEKQGAAARVVQPTPAPGVEAKMAEWTFDQARGVWLDEHGGVHQAVPQTADTKGDDDDD